MQVAEAERSQNRVRPKFANKREKMSLFGKRIQKECKRKREIIFFAGMGLASVTLMFPIERTNLRQLFFFFGSGRLQEKVFPENP